MELCEYLTNGIRLFHVERIRPDGIVELEDCGVDRVLAVPPEQLEKMNLRHVEPLQKGTEGIGDRRS